MRFIFTAVFASVLWARVVVAQDEQRFNELERQVDQLGADGDPDPHAYDALLSRCAEFRRTSRPQASQDRITILELKLHRTYKKWPEYLSGFISAATVATEPQYLSLELLYIHEALEGDSRFAGLEIVAESTALHAMALAAADTIVRRFPKTEVAADALWAAHLVLVSQGKADQARGVLRSLASPPYETFEAGKRATAFLWDEANLGEGAIPPGVTWTTVAGDAVRPSARDATVVLYFWTTHCGPCKPVLKRLQQLSADAAGKPVLFIGLNYDADPETLRSSIKTYGLSGPQVHMPSQPEKFPATYFPRMALIASDGRVKRARASLAEIEDLLRTLSK